MTDPAAGALRRVPARTIVAAVADAAARWCDADFPPRVRATRALEATLGATIPVIDDALDQLFGGLTEPALGAAITRELGSLAALDVFVPHAGAPPAWARGAAHVTIVANDTTIGITLPALIYALCAKCTVLVRERNAALIAEFADTLVEALPEVRDALVVAPWDEDAGIGGADAAGEAPEVILAFGDADDLRAIRAACPPRATVVPFGRRACTGYIDRVALADDLAPLTAAIARDALLDDGGGRHALRGIIVERTDEATHQRFRHALADATAAAAIEFPPGRGPLPITLVDEPLAVAALSARPHSRVRTILVTPQLDDAATSVLAVAFGATRIALFGALRTPPLAGHHDGRPRIADVVRWIDRA